MNARRHHLGTLLGGALLASYWLLVTPAAIAAADPWVELIGVKDAPAWRGWDEPGFPAGWHVHDGVLSKNGHVDDLVTLATYGNFELRFDWKIGKAGNSGIFYRATRDYDHVYWSGPEYQLLDDANAPDGAHRETAAGSAYALYGGPAGVVRPFGHWNHSRLIVSGHHVEHWLNGRQVVEYELDSEDWRARVAASKFPDYPLYGLAPAGMIGIQGDHPGSLEIRHMAVRALP
jgi:hypothetical protein